MQVSSGARRGHQVPWDLFGGGQCAYWETNSGLLQEQQIPIGSELASLQPHRGAWLQGCTVLYCTGGGLSDLVVNVYF